MLEPLTDATLPSVDDSSAVAWLQTLLVSAQARGASDLHFEPYEHSYRVRLRIDGQLQPVAAPPASLKERIASRIKVLARLDIAEKRLPQDGHFRLELQPGQASDLRVSTLPTLFGEKIVIRLLPTDHSRVQLEALGLEPLQLQQLVDAIRRPQGMLLVTGPTGSGKTVTLYSCLQQLNRPEVNIASVEDPCEIRLEGINQVHLHEKAGLSYASVLRAFLRQDPDILMVGEIRDPATADIALKAAQTGHLVLSTLHTLDAPGALTRLQHMGVPPYQLAASISLIVPPAAAAASGPVAGRRPAGSAGQRATASLASGRLRPLPPGLSWPYRHLPADADRQQPAGCDAAAGGQSPAAGTGPPGGHGQPAPRRAAQGTAG